MTEPLGALEANVEIARLDREWLWSELQNMRDAGEKPRDLAQARWQAMVADQRLKRALAYLEAAGGKPADTNQQKAG